MKKFYRVGVFAFSLLSFVIGTSAHALLPVTDEVKELGLKVHFSPVNNPSASEFQQGREKVLGALRAIAAEGYSVTQPQLWVNLSSGRMHGGDIFWSDYKTGLTVSAYVDVDDLQRKLMDIFTIEDKTESFRFFAHNAPSVKEFKAGVQNVLAAYKSVRETGLQLKQPLDVGIAPLEMIGGKVITASGKLYVWFDASPVDIERALIMLCD